MVSREQLGGGRGALAAQEANTGVLPALAPHAAGAGQVSGYEEPWSPAPGVGVGSLRAGGAA